MQAGPVVDDQSVVEAFFGDGVVGSLEQRLGQVFEGDTGVGPEAPGSLGAGEGACQSGDGAQSSGDLLERGYVFLDQLVIPPLQAGLEIRQVRYVHTRIIHPLPAALA
jgi:hypothetical protein